MSHYNIVNGAFEPIVKAGIFFGNKHEGHAGGCCFFALSVFLRQLHIRIFTKLGK